MYKTVPEGYLKYEITVTIDQSKSKFSLEWWEKHGVNYLGNLMSDSRYEIYSFLLVQEVHTNGWPHWHGIFTVKKNRNTSKLLGSLLKRKIGRNQIDLDRDGKLEDIQKDYNTWYDYIVKDSNTVYTLNHTCVCQEKIFYFDNSRKQWCIKEK